MCFQWLHKFSLSFLLLFFPFLFFFFHILSNEWLYSLLPSTFLNSINESKHILSLLLNYLLMRKKTNLEKSISMPGTSPKKKKKKILCYFSSQMRHTTVRNTIAYNDEWTVYCLYQAQVRFLEQYETEHTVRCPKWCSHNWSLSNESSYACYFSATSV